MSGATSLQWLNDRAQPHLIISAHDTGIWRLAYLPDGRRVVTGSGDRTVKVWNLESGEQEGTSMEHENEMADVAVTQDGTKIISSDEHGNIKIWDVETHKLVEEWIHPEHWPKIAISPDDRLIAVGDQAVAIYTMEGRQVNDSAFGFGRGAVLSMSFSPDGDKLACGTDDEPM